MSTARANAESTLAPAALAEATAPGACLPSHMPELDGVRGVAVVLVMALHAFRSAPIGAGLSSWGVPAIRMGWIGVDLFFVLSGLLITGILLESKGRPHYLRNFYWRRALRILPLYYAVLVVLFFVYPLVRQIPDGASFQVLRHDQWWFWLHLQNLFISFYNWPDCVFLDHFWSLAVEQQFYLFWPLLVLVLTRQNLLRLSLFLIAGAELLRLALYCADYAGRFNYTMLPTRCDSLATGAVLALLLRDERWRTWLRARWVAIFTVGAMLSVICFAISTGHHAKFSSMEPIEQVLGYSAHCLMWGALVAGLLFGGVLSPAGPTLLARAMRHGALVFCGKYSYCMYVIHPFVDLVLVAKLTRARLPWITSDFALCALRGVVLLLVTAGLAWLSWQVFEAPFLRLKDRFRG